MFIFARLERKSLRLVHTWEERIMFKVRLFGRDTLGKSMQHDIGPGFGTCQQATDAAERATAHNTYGFRGSPLNYRITGASGATLLDVQVSGSKRHFTHTVAAG
jgi:hypothetical protein